jgi:glycosyltransferase involved in cell wall biosynthesis
MNIVHVEDFIHPDAGYQVNLLSRLQVREGHQVTIVAAEMDQVPRHLTSFFGADNIPARDERFFRETGARIVRVPTFAYYSGRAFFSFRLFGVVRRLKPDAVFAHGLDSLTAMLFTWLSPFLSYPIVLDCHSLEMGSVHRFKDRFRTFYRRFVAPVVIRRNIPVIRVVDSDYVEKSLGIPLSRTDLLSFGTDTDLFRPDPAARAAFRLKHQIADDAKVVLYAGKLDENKGGQFLADALREKLVLRSGAEAVFLIVGNTEGPYGAKVEASFAQSQNRIIRLPTQRYFDLAGIYQSVDMAVFPKQCSMSFFEAQSCGLPILFEENEINCERASHGNARTFRAADTSGFRAGLVAMLELSAPKFQQMSDCARLHIVKNFDFVPIARQYSEVLAGAARRFQQSRQRP